MGVHVNLPCGSLFTTTPATSEERRRRFEGPPVFDILETLISCILKFAGVFSGLSSQEIQR